TAAPSGSTPARPASRPARSSSPRSERAPDARRRFRRGPAASAGSSGTRSGEPAFVLSGPLRGSLGAPPAVRGSGALPPAVVDGADSGPEREARSDRARHVLLRLLGRRGDVIPHGQMRRDRGREGAAGAVGVPVVVPRRGEAVLPLPVGQQIGRLARQVSALDRRPP